jgi:hypothetical protein
MLRTSVVFSEAPPERADARDRQNLQEKKKAGKVVPANCQGEDLKHTASPERFPLNSILKDKIKGVVSPRPKQEATFVDAGERIQAQNRLTAVE